MGRNPKSTFFTSCSPRMQLRVVVNLKELQFTDLGVPCKGWTIKHSFNTRFSGKHRDLPFAVVTYIILCIFIVLIMQSLIQYTCYTQQINMPEPTYKVYCPMTNQSQATQDCHTHLNLSSSKVALIR